MLTNLRLTNYYYSDALEVKFSAGLNIITGATGSGKSVLIAAIEAALGSRKLLAAADTKRKSIMECEFQAEHVNPLLQTEDLELMPALQLRREIRPDNSSRFFVNDTPVRMKLVRTLGDQLVDFHSQNDLSLLLRKKYHTTYVDSFAETAAVRTGYDRSWQSWRETARRLKKLDEQLRQELEKQELHQFQLQELQTAQLVEEEDSQLIQAEKMLSNAEMLLLDIQLVRETLDGDEESVRNSLYLALKAIERIKAQSGLAGEALQTLKEAAIAVEDVALQAGVLDDQVEHNPERLEEIRQRLEVVNSMKRKYGPTLKEVLVRQQALEEGSKDVVELQQERDQVAVLLEQQLQQLEKAAAELTRARQQSGSEIAARVNPLLRKLGIMGEGLKVKLTPREQFPHVDGAEQCEFYISTNTGMAAEPLEKVASGGEMSRVMLALKSVSADFEPHNVLVFDEIDRGVSGKAAAAVGERLQELARTRQVICITHLPQIAALADNHLSVIKEADKKHTRIRVEMLNSEERVEELASLAGSSEVTDEDRKYARRLLATGKG